MTSKSRVNTKSRALDLFEECRTSSDARASRLPRPWQKLSAAQLCRAEVWDDFIQFLSEEYISETADSEDGLLSIGTQLGYLGAVLNEAAARFKATGDDRVKLFFTCLDPKASTDAAAWLKKQKDKMVKLAFIQAREGERRGAGHLVHPGVRRGRAQDLPGFCARGLERGGRAAAVRPALHLLLVPPAPAA